MFAQKRIIYIIIIIFLGLIKFELMAEPTLYFPCGTTIDWGIVKPKDHPLNTEIILQNTGTDTLIINNVQPTCGCTTAPLRKSILAPGEKTSMIITLSIINYTGDIEKVIRVYSNDPKASIVDLHLKANIRRDIFVSPSSFISFTDLKVGETGKQIVNIQNVSDRDVTIKIGSYSPSNLKFLIHDNQVLKKGESFPLEISITPSEAGILKGKIEILTSHPDYQEVPIFIFGDIKKSPLFIGN